MGRRSNWYTTTHQPSCRGQTQTKHSCPPPAVAGLLRVAEGPHRSRHALRRCGRELAAAAAAQPNKHALGTTTYAKCPTLVVLTTFVPQRSRDLWTLPLQLCLMRFCIFAAYP
eukprot:scaffold44025_cov58-Phaeocystis_antarctica.AAC.5